MQNQQVKFGEHLDVQVVCVGSSGPCRPVVQPGQLIGSRARADPLVRAVVVNCHTPLREAPAPGETEQPLVEIARVRNADRSRLERVVGAARNVLRPTVVHKSCSHSNQKRYDQQPAVREPYTTTNLNPPFRELNCGAYKSSGDGQTPENECESTPFGDGTAERGRPPIQIRLTCTEPDCERDKRTECKRRRK